MANKTASKPPSFIRRIELVERITELNSRHLKSEGRRSGMDMEVIRCEEIIAQKGYSEASQAALDTAQHELTELDKTRQEIDEERARLSTILDALKD